MAAPSTKTLSPAELAKLEHAFATDPGSEAYKPLAEAYLGMGRFMEAMVVCKKGVKAHPNVADPRLLLARVYAEQGKDKKALEELQGALQVAPDDKATLRMTGVLQVKNGEVDAGKSNLLKAWKIDPSDADTLEAMKANNVDVPQAATPPPPPASGSQPAYAPGVLHQAVVDRVSPQVAAQANGTPVAHAPPPAPHHQRAHKSQGSAPAPRPVKRQHYETQEHEISSEISEVPSSVMRRQRGPSGWAKAIFPVLLIGSVVGIGGYSYLGKQTAERNRKVNKLLSQATDQLKHDSYDSYQKVCELGSAALDLDPNRVQAHGYLAYAWAIRWGEHRGGDDARRKAEEHLKAGLKEKEDSSHLYAAQALITHYSGKSDEAAKALASKVEAFNQEGRKSSLLYLTLGIIQMNSGDLDRAKESLEQAQQLASDDPRVYAALGTLQRRRGLDGEAAKNFTFALKYERAHPDSMLGSALLILDQPDPGRSYVNAAKMVKALVDADPPPSPRQLATAHMVRALLVSRVAADLPLYPDTKFQKELEEATGVGRDRDKARAEVAKAEDLAMGLDNQNPELLLIRGKRLVWEQNIDAAVVEIKKAIAMDGQRAHFHVELAKALMKKEGGEKEAEAALNKALQLVPGSPKLLTLLAQAQYRQKRVDDAIRTYEMVLKDPKAKNPEARYALGRIYRDDKKNLDKAIEYLAQAASEYYGESGMVARAFDDLALAYDAKGNAKSAKESFERSLQSDRDFEDVYCHYAAFISRKPDADGKERLKTLATDYLKLNDRGACAEQMKRFTQ
ncbi:MAG: tetratricopeptide repeat protein [Myxococcaceae bacterium]|nr:tetratricopeptide repeat protein [Myxococcaceae bacterium]